MKTYLKLLSAFCLAALSACSPTFNTHGYLPPEDLVGQLSVGSDDKVRVAELIGRPSSTGVLNDTGWYYIQTEIRNFTYQQPEVVGRSILAISFDRNDRIANIETLTLADGRVVNLNRRVTELPVRGPTFWQQIVASIGNVQASDLIE